MRLRLIAGATALLALITTLPLLAVSAASTPDASSVAGIPPRVLRAYQRSDAACSGLRWELLAGVGWVESRHGTTNGASVDDASGRVQPPIFGPPLDGVAGQARPIGTWRGQWGLTGPWQQALGPMQLLPGTFSSWALDGDNDGVLDPHDIDDAVASAANYLCGATRSIADERSALRRYNASEQYVRDVLTYADSLGTSVVIDGLVCPVAGPVNFTDTWRAPRSEGRLHKGVDMFAARGTPVVTPTSGVVEHYNDSLGGLSFRLWGDDGNYYYGTHLARFGPRVGALPAGAIVGFVGNSGNAADTGTHLHFEIHPGRQRGDLQAAVNPTPTVAAACSEHRLGVGAAGRD